MMSYLRKVFLIITLLSACIHFTAFADSNITLTLPEGFFIHEKAPEKVAEILGMEQSQLNDYCMNNSIIYLAVDSSNSRQIRATVSDNSFSNNIVNISQLTDDRISSLAPDIAGIEGVRGEVVKLGDQKFLRIQLKSEDSGGEYILTQYITVSQKQNFVLSFYNNSDVNAEYIDEVFQSLSSDMFEDTKTEDNDSGEEQISLFLIIIPIAAIALLLVCIGLGVSIVIDIRKNKDEADEYEIDVDYSENDTTSIEKIQEKNDNEV